MTRAIIFDAEGVIIDSEPAWDVSQEALLARYGHKYDRDEVKPLLTGRSLMEGTELLKRRFDLPGSVDELASERTVLVEEALAVRVDLVPGFSDFLSRVSPLFRTAVATSMEPRLFDLVDLRLGLRRLFGGHVYTLADVGFKSKPHPDLFLYAARGLGCDPADCWVIEDAPYGLEAARRAGMRSIGLATTYQGALLAGADIVTASFAELTLSRLLEPPPDDIAL